MDTEFAPMAVIELGEEEVSSDGIKRWYTEQQEEGQLFWDEITLSRYSSTLKLCDFVLLNIACTFSGEIAVLFYTKENNLVTISGLVFPRQLENAAYLMGYQKATIAHIGKFIHTSLLRPKEGSYAYKYPIACLDEENYFILDWPCISETIFISAKDEHILRVIDEYVSVYFETLGLYRSPSAASALDAIAYRYFNLLDFSKEEDRQLDLICRNLMAIYTASCTDVELARDLLRVEALFWRVRMEMRWPTQNMSFRIVEKNKAFKYIAAAKLERNTHRAKIERWLDEKSLLPICKTKFSISERFEEESKRAFSCTRWLPLFKQLEDVTCFFSQMNDLCMLYDDECYIPGVQYKTLAELSHSWRLYNNELCAKNVGKALPELARITCIPSYCTDSNSYKMHQTECDKDGVRQVLLDNTPVRFFCFVRNSYSLNPAKMAKYLRAAAQVCLDNEKNPISWSAVSAPTWLFCADNRVLQCVSKSVGFGFQTVSWNGFTYQMLMLPDLIIFDRKTLIKWVTRLAQLVDEPDSILTDETLYAPGWKTLPYLSAAQYCIHPAANTIAFQVESQALGIENLRREEEPVNCNAEADGETDAIIAEFSKVQVDADKARRELITEWALKNFLNARAEKCLKPTANENIGRPVPTVFYAVPSSQLSHKDPFLFGEKMRCMWSGTACEVCKLKEWPIDGENHKYLTYNQCGHWFFALYVRLVGQLITKIAAVTLPTPDANVVDTFASNIILWKPFKKAVQKHQGRVLSLLAVEKFKTAVPSSIDLQTNTNGTVVNPFAKRVRGARAIILKNLKKTIEDLAVFGMFNEKATSKDQRGNLWFSSDGTRSSFEILEESGGWMWWKHSEHGGLAELFALAKIHTSPALHGIDFGDAISGGGGGDANSYHGSLLMLGYVERVYGRAALEVAAEEVEKKRKEAPQQGGAVVPLAKRVRKTGPSKVQDLVADKREDFAQWFEIMLSDRVNETLSKSKTMKLAQKIWSSSKQLSGTLGEEYLVTCRKLPNITIASRYLRFNEQFNYESGFLPALVAPIYFKRNLAGVQGIFLNSATATKASVPDAKHTLGCPLPFATINLVEDKELATMEGDEELPGDAQVLIGEGPETMLSVAQAFPTKSCYASLSINNMCYFPGSTVKYGDHRSIIVCGDNDPKEKDLERELEYHLAVLTKRGFTVYVAKPSVSKDFNAMLQDMPGEEGLERIREVIREAKLFVWNK